MSSLVREYIRGKCMRGKFISALVHEFISARVQREREEREILENSLSNSTASA
jgi:hypothetical protein